MDIVIGSFSVSVSFFTIVLFLAIVCFVVFKVHSKQKEKRELSKNPKNKIYSFDEVHKIDTPNTIAIVNVKGTILTERSSAPIFLRGAVSFGDEVFDPLAKLAENSCVSAVIIHLTTPGGTIAGSQAIADG